MLHRRAASATILMTQPAHAWISGQLAAAWADAFEPRAEIVLAAEQHDVGWTPWERRPSFNPTTGLPHTFLELETATHLEIWTDAGERVAPQSALAALLVSRHGTGLYERFHTLSEVQNEPDVLAYLEHEKQAQQHWLERLRAGRGWGAWLSDEAIERASRLIAAWDWLSLIVCVNESDRGEVKAVPWGDGTINLDVVRVDEARWRVKPWPFAINAVRIVGEGIVMDHTAESETEMRELLDDAEVVRVQVELAR